MLSDCFGFRPAVNMLQSAMKWFNVPQFEILGYPIDVNKLLPGGDTPVVEEVVCYTFAMFLVVFERVLLLWLLCF